MEKDVLLKRYLSDNARYADLINGVCFEGKQVVKADDLYEMDSHTGYHEEDAEALKTRKGRRQKHTTENRDLVRKMAFGINFAVVGIENQDKVHYLMPLRTMSYDVGEYERQAALIRKEVRKRKDITGAEYLSGFTKESKLRPCITLVLYYGDEWDGSKDIHDILDFSDIPEQFKKMVGNYSINLLEIKKMENTDRFKTDLKQVFDFIRFSEDKSKLREMVQNDPAYKELDRDAYDVAAVYTGAQELIDVKKYYEQGGRVNMCKALTEMLQDERVEGRAAGEQQMAALIAKLLADDRGDEVGAVAENVELRQQLFKEYGIRVE